MAAAIQQIQVLSSQVSTSETPDELKEKIVTRLGQLEGLVDSPTFLPEFDRMNKYIEWVLAVPWNKKTEEVLDLQRIKQVLDQHHYGLEDIKSRILEYMSVLKLKKQRGEEQDVMRAPIMSFVGLVGTGKTTIAKSIAEAIGRKFARIPFGGMGDPLDLRGKSRMHPEAEPGKVIKALVQAQSRNPVILLDEIDRVTDEGRSSIMGVLVELLDPEQNAAFVDHYIDYPVNLSEVIFIATANNTHHISTAVLDRIEPIKMPSYTDDEKITIAKQYMLPKILQESGVPADKIVFDDQVWSTIVRPLGFDSGIRSLQRNVGQVVRKVAMQLVRGEIESVRITPDNVKQYVSQT